MPLRALTRGLVKGAGMGVGSELARDGLNQFRNRGNQACACGTMNPVGQRFCTTCGSEQGEGGQVACSCGYLNQSGARFCGGCGQTPSLPEVKVCSCGATVDGKFCNECGQAV